MRIWSLHPALLDRQGLVACWRETLLAQAVLAGRTKGYTRHPQLERFRAAADPLGSIAAYLLGVADEADARGYRFDRTKVLAAPSAERIPVTEGQLRFELEHLRAKLSQRDPSRLINLDDARPHAVFKVRPGAVESWERP